jgi:2-dehydro-3-deoxyphosphogluconate aldolase/(4S)-4-hydroxy-2-oxoglutarate aldolase
VKADRFVKLLGEQRGSAILRCDDPAAARRAMEAAVAGGFRIIEFTLTVAGAFELIREFSRRDGITVGAGTVLDVDSAERSVAAGAAFLVSPVVDPQVIAAAARLGVAAMPGAHTPTELLLAHRCGAPLQKLFPAPGAGPAFVKACLGPMPFLRIVPTHGVDADNALDWLRAGAFAVGFVASLFDPRDLAEGRFDRIEERARRIVDRLRGFRP